MNTLEQADHAMPPREAWRAYATILLVLGATLFPLWRGRDGFPLSNYPMFSSKRERNVRMFHVVGRTDRGQARPLSPYFLGTEEVMQAHEIARRAARSPQLARELCKRVAAAVSATGDQVDVVRVEVRVDDFETIEYWQDRREPARGQVIAGCPVRRERNGS